MKFTNVPGLSSLAADQSREDHGPNELPPAEVPTFWEKLRENFEDPLIKILCVALCVTIILSISGYADWIESVGIAVAVFIATFVSTYSEFKNEASFQELQEQASRIKCNVFRNGSDLVSLPIGEIVVGDYVLLQSGDRVPADGRVWDGELAVNQSSLSGERESVRKVPSPPSWRIPDPVQQADMAGSHLLLRGTIVDDGLAVMLVQRVGEATYYGTMNRELMERDERESPLQIKLTALADGISTLGYIGATFIALSFLFKQFIMDQNYDLSLTLAYLQNWQQALQDVVNSVILGVIIIVVAVPEGLPMMIAIVLSLNMRKLLKENVLVRKLLGIETAGSLNLLFVDKTGTITQGSFEPVLLLTGNGQVLPDFASVPTTLASLYAFAARESTSSVVSSDGSIVGGNASDRALLRYLGRDALFERVEATVQKQILFHSERKFSAARVRVETSLVAEFLHAHVTSSSRKFVEVTVVKGAPQVIFSNTTSYYSTEGTREPLKSTNSLMAELDRQSSRGVRPIAIAITNNPIDTDNNTLPTDLCLIGVIGLQDQVRPESKDALASMQDAGIKVIMMTGDREQTAAHVAQEVGLLTRRPSSSQIITSQQLVQMSDEDVKARVMGLHVIAEARPTDKSRLVTLCQQMNLVVGMTGDGVNDSIALKRADVGFGMGSGSEVAKEASDIVVLDDNFASISSAVLYGRTIYRSIQKFIVFQSTVNLASSAIVFLGPFFGFDFPLTLIQLLWVNLVMDTLAALAFGGEPALRAYMRQKPIRRSAAVIEPGMWSQLLCNGIFIAIMCMVFLTYDPIRDEIFARQVEGPQNDVVFYTAFFAFFIFCTVFNAFSVRTKSLNVLENLGGNLGFVGVMAIIFAVQISFSYVFGTILRTVGLTVSEWLTVIAMSSVVIPFDMLRKVLMKPFLPESNDMESPVGSKQD